MKLQRAALGLRRHVPRRRDPRHTGVATAPAFTANQFAVTYTVSATVSGLTGEADFALANQTAIVPPVSSGIVNAATNTPPAAGAGFAPGSFVSIYGSHLGPAPGATAATLR
jgi:hypothetical protein